MTSASITSHDDLHLTAEVSGSGPSSGPGLLLVHANGFCKELWRIVTDGIAGTVVAIDQRGHGGSDIGPAPYDWWDLGRDALGWTDTLPASRIGVGHSSGGAALAMAEILRPGTWDHLVLIEPIVFPGPFQRAETHPLVEGALRRRSRFASRDQARESYAGRGPFARWTGAALDLYVEFGFRDDVDGSRVLVCAPEIEAEFYRMATAHGAWVRLGEIGCPVTLVVGEHSDSHPPEFAVALAARFGDCRLVTIPEASHFVPMEQPDAVRDIIRALASGLSS